MSTKIPNVNESEWHVVRSYNKHNVDKISNIIEFILFCIQHNIKGKKREILLKQVKQNNSWRDDK